MWHDQEQNFPFNDRKNKQQKKTKSHRLNYVLNNFKILRKELKKKKKPTKSIQKF